MLFAGERLDVVLLLRQRAHRLIGERIVKPVEGHVVDQLGVAVLEPATATREDVRSLRHRLLATGHHAVELTGADQLIGQCDRVDSRQTHLVDGQGRDVPADTGFDGGLLGGHLTGSGTQDLTHDHVFDLGGRNLGLFQSAADGDRAQVHCAEILERTHQSSDRGAGSGYYYRCRHLLLTSRQSWLNGGATTHNATFRP